MTTSPSASPPPVTDDTLKSSDRARHAGRLGDRVERRVDHAVARAGGLDLRPVAVGEHDLRGRLVLRAAVDVEATTIEYRCTTPVPSSSATIASRSASVISTLRSASSLNRTNAWFSASPCRCRPIFASVSANAWRPECLPEHDLRGLLADGRGVDDLVGLAVLEHAVLVDAGLVRERVAADDGLVVLDRVAGQAGHQPRRAGQLLGAHADVDAAEVVARVCGSP